MLKVALDLQPCEGQRSGIGIYTYELARRMVSDEQLRFVGNCYNFRGCEDMSKALEGVSMPLQECRIMPYWAYHRLWHSLPINHGMLFPRSDVTHFFNYVVPPRIRGHVLTTIHDITYIRYPETMNERGLALLRRELPRSVDRSDLIIVNSEFVRGEVLSHFPVDAKNLRVIYPAAQLPVSTLPNSALEKWGLKPGYIFYIGNTEPRKNLSRLIRAYKKLREESGLAVQLVLAGGSGWKSGDICRLADETPGVVRTGYVSGEEKALLYRHAGCFAFMSIYEGFGMPVHEAMLAGVPVVCSEAASIPEVGGDAPRYVDPMDENSIAQGLFDVLSNEETRREMIARGLERAKRFSWDASAEKLMNVYREFL